MRLIIGFVIALGAGCGPDTSSGTPDLQHCPTTINEGDPCNNGCTYQGDSCYCASSGVWTCERKLDMATND